MTADRDKVEFKQPAPIGSNDSAHDKNVSSLILENDKAICKQISEEIQKGSRNGSHLRNILSENANFVTNKLVNNVDLELGSVSKRSSGHI